MAHYSKLILWQVFPFMLHKKIHFSHGVGKDKIMDYALGLEAKELKATYYSYLKEGWEVVLKGGLLPKDHRSDRFPSIVGMDETR